MLIFKEFVLVIMAYARSLLFRIIFVSNASKTNTFYTEVYNHDVYIWLHSLHALSLHNIFTFGFSYGLIS